MIELIFACIDLVVALGALAGWAWTLVALGRSALPNAQALATLEKVNATVDERIRAVIANIKPSGQPALAAQLEEIKRRAQASGYSLDGSGVGGGVVGANVDRTAGEAARGRRPFTPVPEPEISDLLSDFVE